MIYIDFDVSDSEWTCNGMGMFSKEQYDEFSTYLSEACVIIHSGVPFDYYYDGENFIRFITEYDLRNSFKKKKLSENMTEFTKGLIFRNQLSENGYYKRECFPYEQLKEFVTYYRGEQNEK